MMEEHNMHEVGSSIIEIAKRLGITRQAVYQKIKEGKLQVENLGNHRYKLLDKTVEEMTTKNTGSNEQEKIDFAPQEVNSTIHVATWGVDTDESVQNLKRAAAKVSTRLRLRVKLIPAPLEKSLLD